MNSERRAPDADANQPGQEGCEPAGSADRQTALAPTDEHTAVAETSEEVRRLLRQKDATQKGRLAHTPAQIAWPGWREVILRTLQEMLTDRVSLYAAGCAFYATLALFPAISMLVSIYGLVFDRQTVIPQLAVLSDFLPPEAVRLIADRVQTLVSQPTGTLGAGLLFSTAFTLWSSANGTKSVLAALNLAYEERERRGFFRYQLTAFTITLCMILATAIGLGILLALPPVLHFLGITDRSRILIRFISFGLLVVTILFGLSLLYRYGPNRRMPRWHWVTPGSLLATIIWVAVSAVFSWYVATFATYDTTYGPLGTIVAVMMWFYVTAYAVLLGAELNAELELQTVRDSTDGPSKPLGQRGAYVADHVADEIRR